MHMAQLMPLPLTVSCFSKIQIGFTFLVTAHLDSPGKGPLNGCVCVCVFKQPLQMNDFATFDMLPFIPQAMLLTNKDVICDTEASKLLLLQPFNGLFSRTTWVGKVKSYTVSKYW